MPPLNAFVTPAYPVLYTPVPAGDRGVDPGQLGIAVALLVRGIPSYLATPVLPEPEARGVLDSLASGDVRVAVVGLRGGGEEAAPEAFVSLLCSDGRRLNLARIPGRPPHTSPEGFARHVTRQIVRGVQIPDLVAAS